MIALSGLFAASLHAYDLYQRHCHAASYLLWDGILELVHMTRELNDISAFRLKVCFQGLDRNAVILASFTAYLRRILPL